MAENQKKITYESDIGDVVRAPSSVMSGNIAVFGPDKTVRDGGLELSDVVTAETVDQKVAAANAEVWDAIRNEYALGAYNAPAWSAETYYGVGDYCSYDGNGYMCTSAHEAGESFDDSKWTLVLTPAGKSSIDSMLAHYQGSGNASLTDLAPAFSDSPGTSYVVNQLVVKDGVLQICTTSGTGQTAIFSTDATVEASISSRIDALRRSLVTPVAPDSQAALGQPADAHLTYEALQQKADRSEVENVVDANDLPYKVKEIAETTQDDDTIAKYDLLDRTVNIVKATISGNKTIQIVPPASIESNDNGAQLSRDFFVVFDVTSSVDVPVSTTASLIDYAGDSLYGKIVALKNKKSTYRFTECARSGTVFLVTCYADPSYQAVLEINKALDDILEGNDVIPDLRKGVYVEDVDNPGQYHKVVVVYNPETGGYDLAADSEIVEQ